MARSHTRIPVRRPLGSRNSVSDDTVAVSKAKFSTEDKNSIKMKSARSSTYESLKPNTAGKGGKCVARKTRPVKIPFKVQLPKRLETPLQDNENIKEAPIPLPENVIDIDNNEGFDENSRSIFCKDILQYILEREKKLALPADYMNHNQAITASTRAVAVDWLIQVQDHLETDYETLHLAVAILDQVIAKRLVPLRKFQLMAITSFFISCKIIERFAPKIDTLVHLCDNAYDREEVKKAERLIIATLGFDVILPMPLLFLKRCAQASSDLPDLKKVYRMANYLLEVGLTDVAFSVQPASQRAAAAWWMAQKLVLPESEEPWSPTLSWYCTFGEEKSRAIVMLAMLCLKAQTSKYKGAYEKYKDTHEGIVDHPSLSQTDLLTQIVIQFT